MQSRFETFTILINRISRNIRKIKTQEMAEYNLKSSHISCLYYLYLADGLTAKDLCDRCEEDKAAISRSLEYLEKNGYIICESKAAKRYKSPLKLTDRGAQVTKIIAGKIDQVLGTISDALTEEERLQFYRSLTLISDGLSSIANDE